MKRALAIDLGAARIGIAVSDQLRLLAHPKETISAKKPAAAFQRILELIRTLDVDTVLVGLPVKFDGSLGPAAENAQKFAKKLQSATSANVQLWDEAFSTVTAQQNLHAAGKKTKNSRHIIDQAAAQVILQEYLDAQQNVSPPEAF